MARGDELGGDVVNGIFEYAAKFICGLQREQDELRLARPVRNRDQHPQS
jgi:hypothetical protein